MGATRLGAGRPVEDGSLMTHEHVVCFNCGAPAEPGWLQSSSRIKWWDASLSKLRSLFSLAEVGPTNPLTRRWFGPHGLSGYRCLRCRVVWFWY